MAVTDCYAMLDTEVAVRAGISTTGYKLIRKDCGWVVYDIIVNGVWMVANYRTQRNDILSNESFAALLDILKDKTAVF